MATAVTTPLDRYLHSSYEPDADFVDGKIEQRPVGEYDHSTWQQALQRWYIEHGRAWGLTVRAELRVQISPTRYQRGNLIACHESIIPLLGSAGHVDWPLIAAIED